MRISPLAKKCFARFDHYLRRLLETPNASLVSKVTPLQWNEQRNRFALWCLITGATEPSTDKLSLDAQFETEERDPGIGYRSKIILRLVYLAENLQDAVDRVESIGGKREKEDNAQSEPSQSRLSEEKMLSEALVEDPAEDAMMHSKTTGDNASTKSKTKREGAIEACIRKFLIGRRIKAALEKRSDRRKFQQIYESVLIDLTTLEKLEVCTRTS